MGLLVSWLVIAAAVVVAAWIVPGVDVEGGFWSILLVAAVLGLVNLILGTILRVLTFPIMVLTLGLFSIVVNMIVLWVTTLLTDRLEIDGFWAYFLAALVIAVVTALLQLLLPERE
jgi:putative membrane protein